MITGLLDVFGFLAVLCRGAILAFAALTVGGVSFSLITLRSTSEPCAGAYSPALSVVKLWTVRSALALEIAQLLWLAVNSTVLMDTTGIGFRELWGAGFISSGILMANAAWLVALGMRRSLRPRRWLLLPVAAIIAAEVMTSHSMARIDGRGWATLLTALHQGATGVWIGGLLFWILSLRATPDPGAIQRFSRRFSACAQVSVGILFLAGIGLAFLYVHSVSAFFGTTYGIMVGAKLILFGLALLLGWLNRQVIHRAAGEWLPRLQRLKALGTTEIGIGFTVILTAASLTSQPPAVDLANNQVEARTIVHTLAPRLPRLQTPPLSSLSPSSRQKWKQDHQEQGSSMSFTPGAGPYKTPTEGDIGWSEYNHHWAGFIVLCAGLLAMLSRGWMRWPRHWPLAFCGLAVFLLLRSDPESWPLGPDGFWESFTSVDVLQHRLAVVMVLAFAGFEWAVQTARVRSKSAALVFPLICAAGGALLVTHSHAVSNIREELIIEYSHLPLAILAVVTGWARWLELRLPPGDRKLPSRIWPVALALLGAVLMLYREG